MNIKTTVPKISNKHIALPIRRKKEIVSPKAFKTLYPNFVEQHFLVAISKSQAISNKKEPNKNIAAILHIILSIIFPFLFLILEIV